VRKRTLRQPTVAKDIHVAHIALLGDSIFDNRSYTGAQPDVVTHLRSLLPAGARATLLAVDGATTRSMTGQVAEIPRDATHVVVSIGGNDALGHSDLLQARKTLTADPLRYLGERVDRFEANYRSAVAPVLGLGLPATLCTIYNGALEDPSEAGRARVALMMFNDVILRAAFAHHASVIDLRLVCNESTDYANPIEPSGRGGMKIARAIARATGIRPAGGHSAIFC
jgi:lysophospholipase L1-like esterase